MTTRCKTVTQLLIIGLLSLSSCKVAEQATVQNHSTGTNFMMELNRVRVDLQPDYSAKELVTDLKDYGLEIIEKEKKSQNVWIFGYDKKKITGENLIKLLKAHAYVIDPRIINPDVQINKKTKTTNRASATF